MDELDGEDIDDPGMCEDNLISNEVITVAIEDDGTQEGQLLGDDIPRYVLIGEDGIATVLNSIPVISVPTTASSEEVEIEETVVTSENEIVKNKDEVYVLNYRLVLGQPDENVAAPKLMAIKKNSKTYANKELSKPARNPKSSRAYKCSEPGCDRSYATLQCLKVHSSVHRWRRGYPCTIAGCNKIFSTQYGRKAHVRVHTGERPYKCAYDLCGKAFNTSGDLQKHIRIHTGERPFKCKFEGCTKAFTTGNILQIHMRSHTGERPFVCGIPGCDRKFASTTNYKNHMRIHSGEKPFTCKVEGCDKRFTEYSSLYKHNAVHNQAMRISCPLCCKSFRQESTLTIHMRTVHKGCTVVEQAVTVEDSAAKKKMPTIQLLTDSVEQQEESPFYILNAYNFPEIELIEFGDLEFKDSLSSE